MGNEGGRDDFGEGTAAATVVVDISKVTGSKLAAASSRRIPVLHVVRGLEKGRVFLLVGQDRYVMGRSRECFISVPDASCSRKHAEISVQGAQVFVKDLGSTNGTRVGGDLVAGQKALNAGDLIQLGDNAQFKFDVMVEKDAQAQAEIFNQATYDNLTKAFNRRVFEEALARETEIQKKSGDGLGVVIMDVDFFKKVNDTYGHPAGDEVLRQIGKRVPTCTRGEDIFARFGGEEFTLLTKTDSIETVQIMMERIRQTIEKDPIEHTGLTIAVTASLGAIYIEGTTHGLSKEDLLKQADEALYEAKHSGRNRCVLRSKS